MTYKKLPYEGLKAFCTDVYYGYGFPRQESEEIADVILCADLYGFESHGVQRLIRYHKSMLEGNIDPKAGSWAEDGPVCHAHGHREGTKAGSGLCHNEEC